MSYLDSPQNGVKQPSRFAAFNVFKLKPGPAVSPPPLPPKDPGHSSLNPPRSTFYNKSLFSRSAASLAPSLSPDSFSGPATPASPYPPAPSGSLEFGKRPNGTFQTTSGRSAAASPVPSASGGSLKSIGRDYLVTPSMDGSTDSSGSCPNPNLNPHIYNGPNSSSHAVDQPSPSGTKSKRSVFKLANLARRNRSRKDLSDAASTSGTVSRSASVSEYEPSPGTTEGDDGISLPWNFQHNIHVDDGYIGLPPSWSSALSKVGFNEGEIAAIHARRRAAATGSPSNTKITDLHLPSSVESPASPHAPIATPPIVSTSSPNILLEPAPRSASLGKGQDALTIHPPSLYSVVTSKGAPPSTIGRTSPAPSPRAPSFSMKSFVSGIKHSMSSDSASTKEGIGGSGRDGGATGEESDQYVFVDGDCPHEGGDQGMGDDALIELYQYDTSSVSSHHSDTSRVQQMSQGQQTPRTYTFPQIQMHRAQSDIGHVSHPLSAHASSLLTHSSSLPIPTPPRGYTAGLGSGPASAPPRTPPKRVYHVMNASPDSDDEANYAEPPPAYVSPKKGEWMFKKEKEALGVAEPPPPPNRPMPPAPVEETIRGPSYLGHGTSREEDQQESMTDTTGSSTYDIPRTADEVLDISAQYSDNSVHGDDAEIDPAHQANVSSPTPPLVIDKRLTKLAALPPRISFHQESSLEDWSESLFSVIGNKGKRSSILAGPRGCDASSVKEKRATIRPVSPLSLVVGGTSETETSNPPPSKVVVPGLREIILEENSTLGVRTSATIDIVEEGDEPEQVEESALEDDASEQEAEGDTKAAPEEEVEEVHGSSTSPSIPLPLDVSLRPDDPSLGRNLNLPASTPPSPSKSSRKASVDSLPPTPPPKPKPKPAPLTLPLAAPLAPPKMNIITGISGRSPVNSLFGAKPQPLPIPIPLSQIRAQLRPAPPKVPHPPPILPLPPLKRIQSQPNLLPLVPGSLQLPPVPSPRKAPKNDSTVSHALQSDSRPGSSQTLLPARANSGDRDSDLSMITVTPATIATAKTEVVRTAVASVVDSDAVSLASRRESIVSTADTKPLALDETSVGERSSYTEEMPDNSMVSETSVSLSHNGPRSKWPTPPPPPVELDTDSTPRRISRFRTTSLGRVSQLQAAGSSAPSPASSHFSHGSSDTISSSTSESAPLTTPKGANGVSPVAPKTIGGLVAEARLLSSTTNTFGGVDVEIEEDGEESEVAMHPPDVPFPKLHPSTGFFTHPLLTKLQSYITPCDPSVRFTNLVEIAEGESGSVFAAHVASSSADVFPHEGEQDNTEQLVPPGVSHVAIKRIPLPPAASLPSLSDDSPVSNKLVSVQHELCLLKNLDHEHLLLLDAIYVVSSSTDNESAGALDTSLWIRMELMERSLADVIGLAAEGLALQDRVIARFTSDILHGLDYLQRQHIAHRDVRSDNLLVNAAGVVKLADFSNAIHVDRNAPIVSGAVGVIYWQAPEMRAGPYNALKVDAWSLGATVWELAETVPPFSSPASPSSQVSFAVQTARRVGSQWPPLTHPEHYSRQFHEFLRLCGRESASRPSPGELLNTPFIRNACGRPVILQLLSQCRAIEEAMAAKEGFTGQS